IVDFVRRIARRVIIAMRAGKGIENRYTFEREGSRISRQITVVLSSDRQPKGDIGTLDLARPDRTGANSLQDEGFVEPSDHVHVQVSSNVRRQGRRLFLPIDEGAGEVSGP